MTIGYTIFLWERFNPAQNAAGLANAERGSLANVADRGHFGDPLRELALFLLRFLAFRRCILVPVLVLVLEKPMLHRLGNRSMANRTRAGRRWRRLFERIAAIGQ
jgi:hypothetical protein